MLFEQVDSLESVGDVDNLQWPSVGKRFTGCFVVAVDNTYPNNINY